MQKLTLKQAVREAEKRRNRTLPIRTRKSVLEKRSHELRKKPTFSQKKATKIARSIATKYFGYRVETEKVLSPYIIDIFIKNIRVGIEIDGGIHDKKENYDNRRDQFLWDRYKVRVYRFPNKTTNNQEKFEWLIWEICMAGLIERLGKLRKVARQKRYIFPIAYCKSVRKRGYKTL